MIRTLLAAVAGAAATTAVAAPAAAQPAPDPWTFELGAGTDNRSKAVSKSDRDPFVFGAATWESASGLWYAGPSFETIRTTGSELELAVQFGARPYVRGFDLNLNAAYKHRTAAAPGLDADALELTADAERSIGPARARLRLQHALDAAGATEAWTWVEAQLGWAVSPRLEASAAVGRRDQDGGVDYTGWDAGVTYALTRALDLDIRYFDTDADSFGEEYEATLAATLSLAF